MKNQLKFLALLLCGVFALANVSFASIGVKVDDEKIGVVKDINLSDGVTATINGTTATITSGGAGDLTFQSTLIATGRGADGSTILLSSSTPISEAALAHAIILKEVGGAGGLDNNGIGSTLIDGVKGQTLTLMVTFLQTNGSWIVTPTTKTGFTKLTFDAKGEYATLLYVDDTVGWIVQATNATITQA